MIHRFGGHEFPATAAFSAFARDTLPQELDPIKDPDNTLMAWMEHEEFLFRTYDATLFNSACIKDLARMVMMSTRSSVIR